MQPKWHTEERNLQAGDVVLVQDSNSVRGKWKMALVKQPHLSEDKKVRRVRITYRTENGTAEEVERPVQRLILLVPVDGTSVEAECYVNDVSSTDSQVDLSLSARTARNARTATGTAENAGITEDASLEKGEH